MFLIKRYKNAPFGIDKTICDHNHVRGVVPGGAMAPPDFGRSVNPISTRETDYAPHIITIGPSGFSDLPTVLLRFTHTSSEEHLDEFCNNFFSLQGLSGT